MSIVVPNFSQIGGFLYFGSHFGFKMATIANRNGRNMDTPCKYPFPLKSLTIFKIFILATNGGHFENFKNKEHNYE
jgi:hypothetical protein